MTDQNQDACSKAYELAMGKLDLQYDEAPIAVFLRTKSRRLFRLISSETLTKSRRKQLDS
jgi:hypothetical protein